MLASHAKQKLKTKQLDKENFYYIIEASLSNWVIKFGKKDDRNT
jgi:hypothetical protein